MKYFAVEAVLQYLSVPRILDCEKQPCTPNDLSEGEYTPEIQHYITKYGKATE